MENSKSTTVAAVAVAAINRLDTGQLKQKKISIFLYV